MALARIGQPIWKAICKQYQASVVTRVGGAPTGLLSASAALPCPHARSLGR